MWGIFKKGLEGKKDSEMIIFRYFGREKKIFKNKLLLIEQKLVYYV